MTEIRERPWIKDVRATEDSWYSYDQPSIRKLASILNKSKSWVDKSLKLAIGLRVYPQLKNERTRHSAYRLVLRKRKK